MTSVLLLLFCTFENPSECISFDSDSESYRVCLIGANSGNGRLGRLRFCV